MLRSAIGAGRRPDWTRSARPWGTNSTPFGGLLKGVFGERRISDCVSCCRDAMLGSRLPKKAINWTLPVPIHRSTRVWKTALRAKWMTVQIQ